MTCLYCVYWQLAAAGADGNRKPHALTAHGFGRCARMPGVFTAAHCNRCPFSVSEKIPDDQAALRAEWLEIKQQWRESIPQRGT